MLKEGAVIIQCDVHTGKVANDSDGEVETTIHAAKVAVVITLESYVACIACKSKVKELTDNLRCTKCNTMQCLSKCMKQLSAKLVIAHSTAT